MPQFNFTTVATYGAQIVTAVVVAALLFSFEQAYHKSYLRHWVAGWIALAIYHVVSLAGFALAVVYKMPAPHPVRIAAALVAAVVGYAQIGWFAFGPYELIRRRPIRRIDARRILIALAIFSTATVIPFLDVSSISPSRYVARVGIRAFLASIVFLWVAIALWRSRKRRKGIGVRVLGAAYLFYALQQLSYGIFTIVWMVRAEYPTYYESLGYADFLLQAVLAIGIVACLLEDEREATELASVQIEHLAYHDALTGLPNRHLFMDRLIVSVAQSHRTGEKLGVLFLDIDRFKDINDSLGHSVGDQLLKSVADRIDRCTREGDTLARFGGDEFTLLVPQIGDVEDAAKTGQKIIEMLKIPFLIGERELFVSASVGVSIYPTDGLDAETLVRNADTAMYRAKDTGRDNYQLYAPAMNARALERLALENMLRKAISQNELILHYQPLIDARSRAVTGVEALIRWRHPELGLLSPAHFISVAEISGLIIPIGEWVMNTALRQLKSWHRTFGTDLRMSVNLSARQFQQPNLVDQIRDAVNEHGVPPTCVELEITESNAMQNAENSIRTLRELKHIGVRIAMDDFGTGYSSLSYLKRFPIDTLKLDQAFVSGVTTDPSDAAIVSAVISMAHSLDLEVVAEGVETQEQLSFLQMHRCDLIQGFFFSAPLSVDEMEPFLMSRSAAAAG
jgi:diguanylate cyclase (GGDEF)-like protein